MAVVRIRILFAGLAALWLTGCFKTFGAGGMPEASFDVESDIEKLSSTFNTATDIDAFHGSPSEAARDRFVSGRLALVDLRYLQYIRDLSADKQQLDAAGDLAALTLNLAGTLVGSARAKTNLAAAAAGLGGAKTSVEKNFLYERSVDALVATMNVRRKEVLGRILGSLSASLEAYPFTQALTDVHEYYLAGTLSGALTFITAQAGEQEKRADKVLEIVRDTPLLSSDERAIKGRLTDSIGAPGLSLAGANKALEALGVEKDRLPSDVDTSKAQLQSFVRRSRSDAEVRRVRQAFEAAGILKP